MTYAGIPVRADAGQASCQALHDTLWRRLLRETALSKPFEAVLQGGYGSGKTTLLRRLYWELFTGQDAAVPMLVPIPMPFDPRAWCRRALLEAGQQWIAYVRREENLASATLLPPDDLAGLCRRHGLDDLARLIANFRSLEASFDSDAFLVEWVWSALADIAAQGGRRLVLMLDGAENGFWRESEQLRDLDAAMPAIDRTAPLQRIWSVRHDPQGDPHPAMASIPSGDRWDVPFLTPEQACSYVSVLAKAVNLHYDDRALAQCVDLWGGVPRWLHRFVERGLDSAGSLSNPEQIIELYLDEIRHGATGRDLESAIRMAAGHFRIDPMEIIHTAADRLVRKPAPSYLASLAESEARDTASLQSLGLAGLAIFQNGEWREPSSILACDFLDLLVARSTPGGSVARRQVELKRKRLLETAADTQSEAPRNRLDDLEILLRTFKGQEVASELLHRAGTDHAAQETITLPHCIGCFPLDDAARIGQRGAMPAMVAWCFSHGEAVRSDEMLLVAHLCEASVITRDEVLEAARVNRRVAAELGVPRVLGWIISESRFSPEAEQEIAKLGFHVSRWADCETIAGTIPSRAAAAGPSARPMSSPLPAPVPEAPPVPEIEIPAPPVDERNVVELRLPPHTDMELVAANTIEQLGQACGFSKTALGQMKMATLEACLNAIEHSANKEKEIRVRLEASPEKFVIIVENEGEIFDPQLVEEPLIEDKIAQPYKRGWGLKLIRKFMDRVVFEPYDRGTRMRMEKFNTPLPAQS